MATEEGMKQWIDSASYEELLRRWRFAPAGDAFFRSDLYEGRVVAYYEKQMSEKKAELGHAGAVATSKRVGW